MALELNNLNGRRASDKLDAVVRFLIDLWSRVEGEEKVDLNACIVVLTDVKHLLERT